MPARDERWTRLVELPQDGWEVPNARELNALARLARMSEREGGHNGMLPARRIAERQEAKRKTNKPPTATGVTEAEASLLRGDPAAAATAPADAPVAAASSPDHDLPKADPYGQPVIYSNLAKDWVVRQHGRFELMRRIGALKMKLRPCVSVANVTMGYQGPATEEIMVSDFFGERSPAVGRYELYENSWQRVHRALRGSYSIPSVVDFVSDQPIFGASRRGTGVGFRRHAPSWQAQVFGRKVWVFAPPSGAPPTAQPAWWRILPLDDTGRRARCGWCARRASKDPPKFPDPPSTEPGAAAGSNPAATVAMGNPSAPSEPSLPPDARICLAHPGDIIYVPHGWWYATLSIDDFTVNAGWMGVGQVWDEAMRAVFSYEAATVERWCTTNAAGGTVPRGALRLAAEAGDAAVLQLLLDRGGGREVVKDPSVAGDVCVAAANTGQVEVFQMLLKAGAEVAKAADPQGTTALHAVSRCGHARAAAWLLSNRADPEAIDNYGQPMHHAAYYGHMEVMALLLGTTTPVDGAKTPAAVAAAQATGPTPAPLAVVRGRAGMQEALQRGGDAPGDLGALEAVRPLLESANAGTSALQLLQWRTPLHLAAAQGHSAVATALLGAQADPNASDAWGQTPANYAEAHGYKKLATLLASAAVNTADSSEAEN